MSTKILGTFLFCLLIVVLIIYTQTAHATTSTLQNQIDTNSQQITDLNKKIAEYQSELTKIGADKKTLKNTISSLTTKRDKIETQISLTQHQINSTNLQIEQLSTTIDTTEKTIKDNQSTLARYLRHLQKEDGTPIIMTLLSSGTLAHAWDDIASTAQVQAAIQEKVKLLQNQKHTLTDSKNSSEEKQNSLTAQKKSLTSQQASLSVTQKSKKDLLTQTDAQESKYQKLLTAAKEQLASFSAFSQNAGGSGLLSNQTSCDSWGCYYNQRDSTWGNNSLNGTQYRLASDGCLVTSMAMVMTHYGYTNVTPQTINSDSGNFASYYPAYLLYTISVDGITATRVATTIDATLATGNPVIVGLHAYGGSHFVVLVSGSKGNYLMRDPYIANAKDVRFSAHYSLGSIYEIHKVVIEK